jgi:hypothetical protein
MTPFAKSVSDALARRAPLEDYVRILREYKAEGLTQEAALATLEGLRAGLSDEDEDRILEVMDFASGFCAPRFRVWEST